MNLSGAQAELWALHYLQRQGLSFVTQNYRCRFGEIDLLMREGEVLVFVEVRLRRQQDFGGAAASIDQHKQRRLIHTAQHYLSSLARIPPCRFDAVIMEDALGHHVEWIKNAFEA